MVGLDSVADLQRLGLERFHCNCMKLKCMYINCLCVICMCMYGQAAERLMYLSLQWLWWSQCPAVLLPGTPYDVLSGHPK